ncbi:hypothetical protein [Marihabitans asiaticum]|uniref:hypothetical protein n=1 Tax=Marihabitans asiaticum TaxID=415218 RepID=UPI001B87FC8D|nr:hypothetical protein [Marihabitans asiaticum]
MPYALSLLQTFGIAKVPQKSHGEVVGPEGLVDREVVHVRHPFADDTKLVADRADSPVLVVEWVAEVAEAFGEHAELGLEVVSPVLVPAREPLLLVEDFQDHGPRVAAQARCESIADDRVEPLGEVIESFLDRVLP